MISPLQLTVCPIRSYDSKTLARDTQVCAVGSVLGSFFLPELTCGAALNQNPTEAC